MTLAPGGFGSVALFAATKVTVAPRWTAMSARANPCRPEERLPIKRTGSIISCVPPALMSTLTPSRLCSMLTPVNTVRASSAIWAGSGKRPAPESVPVKRPTSGFSTTMPRSRNKATFACVAGLFHISVCIAGAKTTGHVATNTVAARRSSARPLAIRAIKSAVAGAITMPSASCPSRT